jgi:hypothetical protein
MPIETNGSGAEPDPDNQIAPAGLDTSGWTLLGSNVSQATGFADQTRLTVYYKQALAMGSETAPTVSNPGAANHFNAFITAIEGVDWTASPIHKVAWGNTSTNDTSVDQIPQNTTTVENTGIVSISAAGDALLTFSALTNATQSSPAISIAKQYSNTAGTAGALMLTYGGLPATGLSGATTATVDTAEEEANVTFAILGAPLSGTFVPATWGQIFDPENQGGEADKYSLWRFYTDILQTGYSVIISQGVATPAPGIITPPAYTLTGTTEPNATFQGIGADPGSGEGGLAWFRGGLTYTVTEDEYNILVTAGYTAPELTT